MSNDETRDTVVRALRQVAPEADAATLDSSVDLRDQLDIDSMDFLNFIIGLHEATGVDIPERDYPKLSSLDACVSYIKAQRGAAAATG
jgi:acyl carrier protein